MILRDPVHGLVAFESPEEQVIPRLIDTPEIQRLRRIRQLGATSMAFPGAEHSRFTHATGSAFVMKHLLTRLRAIQGALPERHRLTPMHERDVLAAALLHDVGHGPLSHLFEDIIEGMPHHEAWTDRMVLDPGTGVHQTLAALDPEMPTRVAALVRGDHPLVYLAKSVSGTFDVDRCDYLLRDAHATGVRYGLFDLDWLLRSLRFAPAPEDGSAPGLAIDGAKGLPAIEAFLLGRLFMYQQVYFHKATRAAEWMIRAALARVTLLVRDGVRLENVPRALVHGAEGKPVALGDYLDLDDAVLSVAMRSWESSPDAQLRDLTLRIRARALYKTFELFGEHAAPDGRQRALEVARDVASRLGFDPMVHVGLDVATDVPFDVDGNNPMVVFSKGPARPLREVSFLLARLAGEVLSRVRLVVVPELRDAVTQALGS